MGNFYYIFIYRLKSQPHVRQSSDRVYKTAAETSGESLFIVVTHWWKFLLQTYNLFYESVRHLGDPFHIPFLGMSCLVICKHGRDKPQPSRLFDLKLCTDTNSVHCRFSNHFRERVRVIEVYLFIHEYLWSTKLCEGTPYSDKNDLLSLLFTTETKTPREVGPPDPYSGTVESGGHRQRRTYQFSPRVSLA